MTKLTDTQCVLLSTAAQRESLSIYPLPTSLKPGGGLHKALTALSTRGLIEERETTDATAVTRVVRLAFLSPAIVDAIVKGEHPASLSTTAER